MPPLRNEAILRRAEGLKRDDSLELWPVIYKFFVSAYP